MCIDASRATWLTWTGCCILEDDPVPCRLEQPPSPVRRTRESPNNLAPTHNTSLILPEAGPVKKENHHAIPSQDGTKSYVLGGVLLAPSAIGRGDCGGDMVPVFLVTVMGDTRS